MILTKYKKNICVTVLACIVAIAAVGCTNRNVINNTNKKSDTEGTEVVIDIEDVEVPSEAVSSDYSGSYNGKISFSSSSAECEGDGVSSSGSVATIDSAGTYLITGSTADGQVVVNVSKSDKVTLILDGADITSTTSSPVQVLSADKTIIKLPEGSVNILTMGSDTVVDENGDPDAAIWSKDDLTLEGDGSLYVVSASGKGIHCKDDVKIKGGNIYVTSADDGIKGNDSVTVSAGNIVIETQADGIKSDNEEDSEKGFVEISGGTVSITSKQDGIQGYSYVLISDGEISISTNGGSSSNSEQKDDSIGGGGFGGGGMGGGMGGRGMSYDAYEGSDDYSLKLASSSLSVAGSASVAGSELNTGDYTLDLGSTSSSSTTSDSSKAIKSETSIQITGGTITIDSYDDAIHSDNTVEISGGVIKASAGDDGVHADKILTISGGEIYVTKSYEGLEGQVINLCGGYFEVTASDDGINAAGKTSSSTTSGGFGGGMGGGMGTVDSSATLNITGGSGIINATGDGVDSNNTITMSDGDYVVYGPTDSGNGAIDYETSFVMTGGSFVAFGSTGMAEGVSSGSSVGYLFVGFTGSANKELIVKNSSGTVVFEDTSPKQYGCVFISNSQIISGDTYTFIFDGEELGSVEAK